MAFTTYGTIDGCRTKDNKFESRFEDNQGLMLKALEDAAGMVNARLDPRFHVPLAKRADGTYDQPVVDATEWHAVAMGYERGRMGDDADRAREQAERIVDGINGGTFALEAQVTLDETGIGEAEPDVDNSGTGSFYVNRAGEWYTGSYVTTYRVEIATGGAVGTATYTVTKDGSSLVTATTTAETWLVVEEGLEIRFTGASSGSFTAGDNWTIVCRPRYEGSEREGFGSGRLVRA